MDLGFTESKEDSNLYFKVEGGRPMMLLLYVDELFLIKNRNSLELQEGELFPISKGLGYAGVVECGWNLLGTRELCSRYPEEV